MSSTTGRSGKRKIGEANSAPPDDAPARPHSPLPLHNPDINDPDFHPMKEPAVSIRRFHLPEEMPLRDVEEHQDPCCCLHHHLADVSVYCERLRMPSIDANPPVGADGVLYDGIMLHRYNPTFLRTFDGDSAKIIPRFKGRITSFGVPSQVSFYDRRNERKFRFGIIDVVDINSLSDDKLSQYQKICFPPPSMGWSTSSMLVGLSVFVRMNGRSSHMRIFGRTLCDVLR